MSRSTTTLRGFMKRSSAEPGSRSWGRGPCVVAAVGGCTVGRGALCHAARSSRLPRSHVWAPRFHQPRHRAAWRGAAQWPRGRSSRALGAMSTSPASPLPVVVVVLRPPADLVDGGGSDPEAPDRHLLRVGGGSLGLPAR
ncbi:unnamed protein product [Lampetra planeri]